MFYFNLYNIYPVIQDIYLKNILIIIKLNIFYLNIKHLVLMFLYLFIFNCYIYPVIQDIYLSNILIMFIYLY